KYLDDTMSSVLSRRQLLIAAAATPSLLVANRLIASPGTYSTTESFSFVFMTDTHIQPELDATEGCRACFRQISTEPADFVIHGGDHVFDALEVDRKRALMQRDLYFEVEKDIGKKVYHTIGNHDCFGLFPTSGVAPKSPGYGKEFYTERFGALYYAFNHKGVHFIVLDSIGLTSDRSYEGRLDPEQLEWLRTDLAALAPGTRIIISTHIPLITALMCYEPLAWTKTVHNWSYVVNARAVLALLRGHRVLAVLQGHSHVAETVTLNGIAFITGGAVSGNWWEGRFLGTDEGYMLVTVDGDKVSSHYKGFGFKSAHRQDIEIGPEPQQQ
ncbi:metallophosphoesterase family protein, partial [Xanthomonas graminis]